MLINFVCGFFLYKSSNAKRNKTRHYFSNNKTSFLVNFSYGILGGILITILLIVLFHYLKSNDKLPIHSKKLISSKTKIYANKPATSINRNAKYHENKKTKTSSEQLQSANNYDFYNLLSNEQKSNATTNTQPNAQINHPSASTSATTTSSYLLHLGTFTKLAAADELKAKLILHGFEVNIQTITSSTQKDPIYKVTLGPFASQSIAIVKKSQLDVAGFKNILIKNI